ncbi:sugar isomerase domain-containing protein [Alsobacter sp. SYSU M60028]|uniref:Sugar isomerase domain-containing protein n=1 Tax=Alsobacter ponti TaxID=2962936 RepID=A0ABT1LCX9_9HYPH|nr:sugar isomerase domain-containing protein [Alsobacter ponti]MCP8939319.1 sugar isomerase domain-containing protein [Alsobacter ponti]
MTSSSPAIDADALCADYLATVTALMGDILREERDPLDRAAARLADQIAEDRLVHVYGPGGHSNLAAQEIFFRAGGLMHVSAILDEGTLLSNGALRSMAVERTPGYGKIVIADRRLGEGDLLILVNAYGINAALIDAALEAKARGVVLIGVSSRRHAEATVPSHPARHPTKKNLHDLVDIAIDTKVAIGDTGTQVPGMESRIAAVSTFANAFALNCLVIRTVAKLVERGIEPPVWRSGNAPGGDEANARFLHRFRERVRWL